MNSMHNNGSQDKSLNDDLEDLRQVYQQLEPDEPPQLLDQAILNSAHRAVAGKTKWMDFGWLHGLTTAAVVVLAISVVFTQYRPLNPDISDLLPTQPALTTDERSAKGAAVARPREQQKTDQEDKDELYMDIETGARKKMAQPLPAAGESRVGMGLPAIPEEAMVASPAPASLEDKARATEFDSAIIRVDKVISEQSYLTADQELQIILKLKQAGDDRWKDELKAFLEHYPDYPLPDELIPVSSGD